MESYRNLDDDIKEVFLIRCWWLGWLISCHIYCIIIWGLHNIIGQFPTFLLAVLAINTVWLAFTIVDIFTMLKNNKREQDAWFFEMVYGFLFLPIPGNYYIATTIGMYKFTGYEFIIILTYTALYIVLAIRAIIPFAVRVLDRIREMRSTLSYDLIV